MYVAANARKNATAKTKVENIIVFFMYLPWTSFHPGFPRCGGDVEKHVKKESSVPSIFANLQTSFNSLIKAIKKIVFSCAVDYGDVRLCADLCVERRQRAVVEPGQRHVC